MKEYKINITASTGDGNDIKIDMDADNGISAYDFIRIMDSLSKTTMELIQEYVDKNENIREPKDVEQIKLKDLGK